MTHGNALREDLHDAGGRLQMQKVTGAGGSPVKAGKVVQILGGRRAGQMMN